MRTKHFGVAARESNAAFDKLVKGALAKNAQYEGFKDTIDQSPAQDVRPTPPITQQPTTLPPNKPETATRQIDTGLSGPVPSAILNSVLGQLSDGKWENTPGMEKYWKYVDIAESGGQLVIVVDDSRRSGFSGRDDTWVKNFFADKIKNLVYDELGLGSGKSWSRQDTTKLDYLGHGDTVTVSDAYQAYNILKGRRTAAG